MLTLPLWIGAGYDATWLAEPESELPEQPLTLTDDAQTDTVAALHELREHLAIPEIPAEPAGRHEDGET
nr:hypothetical protein [uncultured Paludibaculum sp.]